MYPSAWLWVVTVGGICVVLVADLALVPVGKYLSSLSTRAGLVALYAALSVLFGCAVWAVEPDFGGSFFAGWISAYSLSIDVVFVFLLITVGFVVPRRYADTGVVFGAVATLVCCGVFTGLGPVPVSRFTPVFYLVGAILIYAGFVLFRRGESPSPQPRRGLGWAETGDLGAEISLPHSKPVIRLSLAAAAVVAIAVVFAMHSVPPLFNLTGRSYLVFCANAGALLGLRHLFFLIGGMIERAIHAETGLGVVLACVGLKLVLDAADQREHARMPEMIWFTFTSVTLVLAATVLTSRMTSRRLRSAPVAGTPCVAGADGERSARTGPPPDTVDES